MAGLIPSRCPPDKQEKATLTVLEQAELLWGGRSGVAAASGAARQPLAMGHGVLRRGAFRGNSSRQSGSTGTPVLVRAKVISPTLTPVALNSYRP